MLKGNLDFSLGMQLNLPQVLNTMTDNQFLTQAASLFSKLGQSMKDAQQLVSEIRRLQDQVTNFESGCMVDGAVYREWLLGEVLKLLWIEDETLFLEPVITLWHSERGRKFADEKAVDEFYCEVELLRLWVLIVSLVINLDLSTLTIKLMRTIIRRYSNMPQLWLFLINYSCNGVQTAYTF